MAKFLTGMTSLFLLFTFASCASKEDRQFSENGEEDMVEDFNLASEKLEKFRSKGLEDLEKEKASADTKDEKEAKAQKPREKTVKAGRADQIEKEKSAKKGEKAEKKKESVPTSEKTAPEKKEKKKKEKEYPKEYAKYDRRSEDIWSQFVPNSYRGEKFVFEISYFGITIGNVMLKTEEKKEIAGKEVFHFRAHLKSASYYSSIYSLDDRLESFVGTERFLPVKYTLTQRESGQRADDLQLFDHEERKTYFYYKQKKDGEKTKKEKEKFIPKYFQGTFSSLYFVRGLPLEVGKEYGFPLVMRAKLRMLSLEVVEVDEVKIMDEWVEAIKINASTHYPGVTKKKGKITFWYSNDNRRRLLQFQADVKLGSIKGELIEYEPGTKAQ